jgi:hypothetical protein
MGSDDLFKKRKARKVAEIERKQNARTASKRYLIVCEGAKTEPHYLRDLRDDLRIRPERVRIAPNDGNTPDRIVEHALKLYQEDERSGDSFDRVFLVFDRDQHSSYAAAVQRAKDLAAQGKPFVAITSVPCFEYWLLLHFGFTDQPFNAAGRNSGCDNLITVLKTKPGLETYGKGDTGIYALLKSRMATAATGGARSIANAESTGQENPSTRVHELVKALQEIPSR